MTTRAVRLTLYRWAGAWGPFKVKIPCGECALTADVIADTLETELRGIPVELEIREWLNEWWKPLPKGGWHAPIVMVEGKVVSQGHALNRGVLTEAVIAAHVERSGISGNHLYGKETCPHCVRAKGYLERAGVEYLHHDVVKEPRALYEMIGRVKPIVGPRTPITVPQIWIDGNYVGGADELGGLLDLEVEPNPERGRNSLSASRAAGVAAAAILAAQIPSGGADAGHVPSHQALIADYPTIARADYVFGCMAANGQTRDVLERCSCSIDVVASILPYEKYVEAEAVLRVRQVGGEKTSMFRSSQNLQNLVADLRRAQIEAEFRCF